MEQNNQEYCYNWWNSWGFFKSLLHLRAEKACGGQRQGHSLELRTHSLSSDGPGQSEKEREMTGHTGHPEEKVRKPIPESETLGFHGEGCSAGNSFRETGHSPCVGTGPPHPACRQWLPSLLCAWSWPVSPVSIPQSRPTPVALFTLQGTPISHHTGLRALPN